MLADISLLNVVVFGGSASSYPIYIKLKKLIKGITDTLQNHNHFSFLLLFLALLLLSPVSFWVVEQQHNLINKIKSNKPDAVAMDKAIGWFNRDSTSIAESKFLMTCTVEVTN